MSKNKNHHVRAAREHVFTLFRAASERALIEYHHFARTREIVEACKEIAKGSKLDDGARDVAVLSAWFYDTCYTAGSDDHAKSLELCLEFLEQQHAIQPSHEQIVACFQGTAGAERTAPGPADGSPVEHVTASDVLHDARLAVLAASDYVERVELLRFELQRRSERMYSDIEWTQHCISFFGAHPYRTRFAQLAYGSGRAANLARLQKQLRKQLKGVEQERADDAASVAKRIGKSAESVYYHFTRVGTSLIAIADHRTSTMIHVNAIMISITVALLARKIETERDLLWPAVLLLAVNLLVVFLSINSMRVEKRRTSAEAIRMRDANLLALMNEVPLTLSEYTDRMSTLVADPPEFQRKVLEHLYFVRAELIGRGKSLRLTYAVFLYGIALAVVAFVVVLARR